jgi:hypothetical protein
MNKTNKIEIMTMAVVPGLITVTLINIFLSGKIIDIPKGTHQGGIISAIGVLVIVLTVLIFSFIFFKIYKNRKKIV